jgi:glycosyltransferase involved in cell wall biosynthesis
MTLRIAVDVRSLMDQATGIGRYTAQLVRALLQLGHDVSAFSFGGHEASEDLSALLDEPRVRFRRHPLPMRVLRRLWMWGSGPILEDIIGSFDVLLAADSTLPRTRRPAIAVIHDVLALEHPEWFNAYTQRAAPENVARALESGAVIVTMTEHVKRKLVAMPHADVRRIFVVPAAHTASPAPGRAQHGSHGSVLFCGTREPRKGLGRVAEALLQAKDAPRLVVVGPEGWGTLPGQAALDALHAHGRLAMEGYVSDTVLMQLRANAAVVVVPSLDEGFGLPLLEAMGDGCAIVASDIEVFREIARDGVHYADPLRTPPWIAAIDSLLASAPARAALGARARDCAAAFAPARQERALATAIAGVRP